MHLPLGQIVALAGEGLEAPATRKKVKKKDGLAPAPRAVRDAIAKAVADPEIYRESLEAWMTGQMPNSKNVRVHDVDMPRSTGFSNETVFFSTTATQDGSDTTRKWVARIEPPDGGIFPEQTGACAISAEVQHRIMAAVRESGVAPIPEANPGGGARRKLRTSSTTK